MPAASLLAIATIFMAFTVSAHLELHVAGAGAAEVNGWWAQQNRHNDGVQFRKEGAGSWLELFFHIASSVPLQTRWVIQRVLPGPAGARLYTDVLYMSNISNASALPTTGWACGHDNTACASNPSLPTHVVQEITAGYDDCDSDACFEYYIQREFVSAIAERADCAGNSHRCQCENLHWLRRADYSELNTLQQGFSQDSACLVENALITRVYTAIRAEMIRPKPSVFWSTTYWNPYTNRSFVIANKSAHEGQAATWLDWQHTLRKEGKCSYTYDRPPSPVPWFLARAHSLLHVRVQEWLQSVELQRLVSTIAVRSLVFDGGHLAMLHAGQFFGPCVDPSPVPRVGVILILTHEWRITHGGLLLAMEPSAERVAKAFPPTGNALAVFDLSRGHPLAISELARRIPDPLPVVLAWFRPVGTPQSVYADISWTA